MQNKYLILTSCYNEELAIDLFLSELDNVLKKLDASFILLIMDDASIDNTVQKIQNFKFTATNIEQKLIQLNQNVGHQEAIRQGIKYVGNSELNVDGVIVMDCDGEDDPNAIQEIIQIKNSSIIFVERGKRKESLNFKIGYFIYKLIFRILTGNSITYGNYSYLSLAVVKSITNQSFLHYASFISKLKLPINKIKYDRRERIGGLSKMNNKQLIFHGLNALIEYAEEILFFIIKCLALIIFLSFIFGGVVLYKKFISDEAILGWASTIGIVLIAINLIILSTIILGLLLISIKKTLQQQVIRIQEF